MGFAYNKFKSLFLVSVLWGVIAYLSLLTDNIIVGNILGPDALIALTLTSPIFTFDVFVSMLMTVGTCMLYSYTVGEGNRKKANEYFSQSIILAVGIGILLTAVMLIGINPLLDHLNINDATRTFAKEYAVTMCIFPLVQNLEPLLYGIIFNEGEEKLALICGIVQIASNIVLSIILGISIGIVGVGLGTIISTALEIVILCLHFFKKENEIHFSFYLNLESIFRMLKYSISDSCVYLFMTIMEMVVNFYLIHNFDQMAVAVFAIIFNIIMLMNTIFDGTFQSGMALFEVYHSENNYHGIIKTIKITLGAAILCAFVISLILFLFPNAIINIFGLSNSLYLNETVKAIRIIAPITIVFAGLMFMAQYYVYMEYIWLSLLLNIAYLLIFPIAGVILGNIVFGFSGVWIGLVLGYLVASITVLLLALAILGKSRFPFLIDFNALKHQHSIDVPVSIEGIAKLLLWFDNLNLGENVDSKIKIRMRYTLEESMYQMISNNELHNVSKKGVAEYTIIQDDTIKIIYRNNCSLHDHTKENTKLTSLEERLSYSMLSKESGNYVLTNGYNKTVYTFPNSVSHI